MIKNGRIKAMRLAFFRFAMERLRVEEEWRYFHEMDSSLSPPKAFIRQKVIKCADPEECGASGKRLYISISYNFTSTLALFWNRRSYETFGSLQKTLLTKNILEQFLLKSRCTEKYSRLLDKVQPFGGFQRWDFSSVLSACGRTRNRLLD